MGTGAAGALSSTAAYVGWKEVFVSSDKGRREVHYYLKRKDGASDLAVVGKEKSPRHMTYRYALQNRSLLGDSSSLFFIKLRSRREVVDWLNNIIPERPAAVSLHTGFGSFDEREAGFLSFGSTLKDVQRQNVGHYENQFLWLGSPWTCKKKQKHYQCFCRNGVKISVNNFVFVLAEENKQLVAYLEDMYEDLKGSKMVVVRWFHRIDEVDIDLTRHFSDREVFFSHSLQDLNIECIDGLATVLSPHHFDKYLNEVGSFRVKPFVCHRLFDDDDDIKPFDITQVKGYWAQEIVHSICLISVSRASEKSHQPDYSNVDKKGHVNCPIVPRPRKRLRLFKDSTMDLQCGNRKVAVDIPCLNGNSNVKSSTEYQNGMVNYTVKEGTFATDKQPFGLAVGCEVEVLSQDSGMRGCWFRAAIVKKHKDKVKVRYHDVQDADDEINSLEEWVSSSKIVVNDNLGLRLSGRTTLRPSPPPHNGKVSWAIDVGALVDAWWFDAWWEGIVLHKESDEKVRVYFPGEKRVAVFPLGELRHSREWLDDSWKDLHGRADLAAKILVDLKGHQGARKAFDTKTETPICNNIQHGCEPHRDSLHKVEGCSSNSKIDHSTKETENLLVLQDLSKDEFLGQLQWKSSRKRSRAGHSVKKRHQNQLKKRIDGLEKVDVHRSNRRFLGSAPVKPLKVDHENCKFIGDSLFNPSAPPVSSLVMSR